MDRLPLLRRRPKRPTDAHFTDERVVPVFEFEGVDFYDGVVVGAATIGEAALAPETLERAWGTLDRLEADDYLRYVRGYLDAGRELPTRWRYADIVTVLCAAARLLQPRSYLEIGVRGGRSMAIVAAEAPDCDVVGVDLWAPNYAGMENLGPPFVHAELAKTGHRGSVELLSGDSHELLPQLFASRPELSFDLITVDGDHSDAGAAQDIHDVLPRLRIGGALVFDDIRHRHHPNLHAVWQSSVQSDRRYGTWEFDDVGYGVAVAVRRW